MIRRRKQTELVVELRVTLRDITPAVWRVLRLRTDASLAEVHAILQEVMGWQGYHLYEFRIGTRVFDAPDSEGDGSPADETTIQELDLSVGSAFEYAYAFGDDWIHDIVVDAIDPGNPEMQYPVCLRGGRACPPEDSGGPHRYAEMLRIVQEPDHPDFAEYSHWLADDCNPECFDRRATNRILMLAFGGGGAV